MSSYRKEQIRFDIRPLQFAYLDDNAKWQRSSSTAWRIVENRHRSRDNSDLSSYEESANFGSFVFLVCVLVSGQAKTS